MARVAPARRGRGSGRAPNHVRRRRRASSARIRGALAGRIRSRRPSDRERSARAASARRVRRGRRRPVSGPAHGHRPQSMGVVAREDCSKAWSGAGSEPDDGIWEVRGPRRHFTHSKVMAWVAFDRAIKSVERFGLEGPVDRWRTIRDEIHAEVCSRGFEQRRQTFTQSYQDAGLDAALLLIPLVGFLPPTTPGSWGRWRRSSVSCSTTASCFATRPGIPRRRATGCPPAKASSCPCSFWLADAYIQQGRPRGRAPAVRTVACGAERRRPAVGGVRTAVAPPAGEFSAGISPHLRAGEHRVQPGARSHVSGPPPRRRRRSRGVTSTSATNAGRVLIADPASTEAS